MHLSKPQFGSTYGVAWFYIKPDKWRRSRESAPPGRRVYLNTLFRRRADFVNVSKLGSAAKQQMSSSTNNIISV